MADKIAIQQMLTDSPERLELARSYGEKLNAQGRVLLGLLYMLVRNVKLYDPSNNIFTKPMEQLTECINTIHAMDKKVDLQGTKDAFYLNNQLIKTEANSLDTIRYLLAEFQRRNVGGFVLSDPITPPEIRTFISIFAKNCQDKVGERGMSSQVLSSLKVRKPQKIKEIISKAKSSKSKLDGHVDRKVYSVTVYSRLIYFMRKYFLGLRGEGAEVPPHGASQHLRDLVDIIMGRAQHFLGFCTTNDDEYLVFHSVNTTMMSLLVGSELGFTKEQLYELGMSTLFHDIGKVGISDEILLKRERLNAQEKQEIKDSPLQTAKRILGSISLNKLTVYQLITAIDHMTDYGTPIRDLRGEISFVVARSDLIVYAKILTIVDCYEALTSPRPFRDAYSPEVAMALMWSELKHRFDPDLLRIFMNIMRVPSVRPLVDPRKKIEIF